MGHDLGGPRERADGGEVKLAPITQVIGSNVHVTIEQLRIAESLSIEMTCSVARAIHGLPRPVVSQNALILLPSDRLYRHFFGGTALAIGFSAG